MKNLMHILFLSCFKATELIEKKFHFKLSIIERLQLGVHKKICDVCLQYEKQSQFIENTIAFQKPIESHTINIDHLKREIINQIKLKG